MARKVIDLTGQVFGRLSVKKFSHMYRGAHWLVECSCGLTKVVSGWHLRNGKTKSCGCIRRIDLVGQVFGRLTVISFSHMDEHKSSHWVCQCECGNICTVFGIALKNGNTRSCGCLQKEGVSKRRLRDLSGQIFGRLTAIKVDHMSKSGNACWLVECSCGKNKVVEDGHLVSGSTISCGCYRKEQSHIWPRTHGLSKTSYYIRTRNRNRLERKQELDSCWTPLMELCLRDYQPVCVVCGSAYRLATDHVLPLSKGNGLYPGNGVILCNRHNSIKGAKSLDQLPVEMATKIREAAESFRIAWSGGF